MSGKSGQSRKDFEKGQKDASQESKKGTTLSRLTGIYYQPPSDPDRKKTYDGGWKNAKKNR